MKKKKFGLVLSICLMFIVALLFAGCSLFGGDDQPKKGTLTADMIEIWGSYYYDGTEQTPSPSSFRITYKGNFIAYTAFEYEFWDNIEVGTAYVRVTAIEENKYLKGSAVTTFQILPGYGQTTVTTLEEIEAVLNGNHYAVAVVTEDVNIPEGYTITIPAGKHLDIRGSDVVNFTNNGTIVINEGGSFSIGGSNTSYFLNNSNISGSGQINVNSYGVLFNSGNFSETLSTIINYGHIYSNTELNYGNLSSGTFTLRQQLSNENISLKDVENGKFVFTDTARGVASLVTTYPLGAESTVTYNINDGIIGNASVDIVASEKDRNYYGSLTLNYEVVKGEKTCTASTFLSAKATGYYNKYTITGTYPSFNDDVTINEDETVLVQNSIDFYGKLTNNGSIVANKMITCDGALENNGVINAKTINTRMPSSNSGNISPASLSTLRLTISSSFENNGTITATSMVVSVNATLTNSGTIQIDPQDDSNYNSFNNGSRLVNNSTGTIILSGTTSFNNINLLNNGLITNVGKIDICDNFTDFSGTGTFDNSNGQIWAFDQMKNKGIAENITYRKRLTDAEVVLSENTYVYDTYAHKPSFTVDNEIIDDTKYSVTYTRKTGTADSVVGIIKNVGEIEVKININSFEYEYGGSKTLTYTITPGAISVGTYNDFSNAIADSNYGSITLTDNIEIINYRTIQENQIVYTNGYSISSTRYTFTNRGTLVLAKIGDEVTLSNCALHISNALSNYGTIINNSMIYVDTDKRLNNYGTIQNDGIIYTWDGSPITAETGSTGQIYERKSITAATSAEQGAVNLSFYETDYAEGSEIFPGVTILNNSTTLNNDDFNIVFTENVNAGIANVTVTPKSIFNENYVGSTTAHFTINRITHNISTQINSNNYQDYFDDTNYYKFTLTANINVNHSVSVPAGLIIDMGQYRFIQNSGYKINLGENVEIYMETDQLSDFKEGKYYQYVATKITLCGNIGTSGTAATIEHSLENENVDKNTFFVGEDPYNFTLDLNGYNLYARVNFYQNCKHRVDSSIINSSTTKKSTVGYTNQSYSIEQNGANGKDAHITIDNIRMNSLWITSHNIQTINVSNCIIENTYSNYMTAGIALYIYNVRDYNGSNNTPSCLTITHFTNCSFTGYTAAYIQGGGHHTFENCTFTSNGTNYRTFTDQYFKRNCNALTVHYITEPISVDITGGSMSKTTSSAYLIEVIKNKSGTSDADTMASYNAYSSSNGYHFAYGDQQNNPAA